MADVTVGLCRRNERICGIWLASCAILNRASHIQKSQAQLKKDKRVSAIVKTPDNPQDIT